MAPENKSKSHWPLSILNSFSSLINMLMPIVLVRLISTDMIGLYKVFFLYVMVGPWSAVMTGIQIGLYYWVGIKDNRTIIQQAWTLLTLFAAIVLIVGLIFLKPISSQLGWSIQITLLFVLYIPLTVIVKFYEDYTIASGEIKKGAL